MRSSCILILLFFSLTGFSQKSFFGEIYFDSGKDELSTSSKEIMDSLINKILPDNKLILSVSGHCDSVGTVEFNNELSLKRSEAAKNYLLDKNIKADSLIINGFGESQPKYSDNEWGKNRRVEIVFTLVPVVKQVVEKKSVIESFVDTAKVGDKIALGSITFYPGTPYPMPESDEVMNELYKTLLANPSLEISIEGHICCAYSDPTNLSTERAKAVFTYLVKKGIAEERLSYIGFGHTRPLTAETNEFERQMNRRVEIRIVKK
jgi:outer membrane protein OmpA-like peptidoglycan-associated protein